MRLGLGIAGVACLALSAVPAPALLAVLQSSDSAEALVLGTLLFRGCLVFFGGYLLFLAMVATPSADRDHLIHFDIAPPKSVMWLIGILVVAVVLRSYALDREIWFDEMLMHVGYMALEPMQVFTTFNDANNHILYTFLARLSIESFGDSVWAIRLPAVAFGIASIAAIYAFSRRVMSWQEALLAAALLAVSYHHIWFSQNARGYTALLFFSLLSSMFLLDAMRTGQKWRWMTYAVVGALGAYTHLTIGFLFIGHFVYVVFHAIKNANRGDDTPSIALPAMGFGFVPLGLITIILYAIVLPNIFGGALLSTGLQEDSEWTNPIWALRELVTSLQIGFSGSGVILVGGIVVLIGMVSFMRRDWAPVAFLVIPCGLAVLLMTSIGYTLFPRFFFFAMGFGIVIVIHGAFVIGQFAARVMGVQASLSNLISAAPALLLIAGSVLSLQHVYFPKQSYGASIAYLEDRLAPNDAVAVIGVAELPYLTYYGKDWTPVNTADEIEVLLRDNARVWTVYTLPVAFEDGHPDIAALLKQKFTTEETFYSSLGGGEIVVSVSADAPTPDE